MWETRASEASLRCACSYYVRSFNVFFAQGRALGESLTENTNRLKIYMCKQGLGSRSPLGFAVGTAKCSEVSHQLAFTKDQATKNLARRLGLKQMRLSNVG